jgi:hypothetical protein
LSKSASETRLHTVNPYPEVPRGPSISLRFAQDDGILSTLHHSANPDGIPQHLQAVAHDAHFAFGRVVPFDGQVGDLETEFLRQQKHFDIEGKAVDLLPPEDRLRRNPAKGLEPALRVVNTRHRQSPQDGIKRLSHVPAEPALLQRDAAFRVLAIAEQYIRAGMPMEIGHEGIYFAQRNTKVSIHVKDEFTVCRQHSGAHREAFSAMPLVGDDTQIRLAGACIGGYLARPVCAGFHNDDYFH